mmetsp:Transcript_27038/g.46127  ORF Transcript_27038/g.46127 Transcript_27038/m.46127 type:complete len:187 (-) Transcript_27038:318-878(-)|eukprot:CAMPEP_0183706298 /NCGR_PEP_ID=MMETSP0737-20130205/3176_1 /TAXON_ID=385413 /ORGANISM="Thalassiosira miniscula, Strain CCMP1093" /LENGTH=186 /DNA_ID=CAMNT_0025933681 /DNA_START=54 /DNA_END=614 /DNA_ORIENTATION=+
MTSSKTYQSFLLALIIVGASSFTAAFQIPQQRPNRPNSSSTRLHVTCDGRRNFLNGGVGAAMSVIISGTVMQQPAEASYSAYTRREEDWKDRAEKGEVKFSNASQLRAQLRDIAPMNAEGSKIFCPNGPSAAVSPLMENKCGDRMALPSVYGRSDDAMGNSIPGFGSSSAATLRAELNAQAYFRDN